MQRSDAAAASEALTPVPRVPEPGAS